MASSAMEAAPLHFSPPRRKSFTPGKVVLGICAMEKKATSKPMRTIIEHIVSLGDIEVVSFPEEMILNAPIEEWPHPVNVLISFFSDGFPLDKAEAYVALRQPHVVNDLTAQRLLLDRRRVYALLEENGIPHPQALIVERNDAGELQGAAGQHFSEAEDFLCIGDQKIAKPFVEKPVDAEDHNICIYYPSSMGGGVKRLFRKVGDQSSSYDPHTTTVRHDGSYMYEPFMKTQGTDIKVYTVGPEYAHAEARKSPVLDGVVNRDQDGKEVRVPVVLSLREKEIARRVCLAFGQTVCGFDLLRTTADSYVIDVNGWSFVKGVAKYYEDAAMVLHDYIMKAAGRSAHRKFKRLTSSPCQGEPAVQANSSGSKDVASHNLRRSDRWQNEELLAVLAVLRHGDRTPKNKMKMTTTRSEFIQLHTKWASGPHKDVKLKTPKQLQEVLDLTNAALERIAEAEPTGRHSEDHAHSQQGACANSDDEAAPASSQTTSLPRLAVDTEEELPTLERTMTMDYPSVEALRLIRAVLKEGGHFDGIYRKVQIKPTTWDADDQVTGVLLILKYGGILTPAGVMQAENLGRNMREAMYPTELDTVASASNNKASNGLLRLHATQRHDFKVYSSDEGRVQMSAAAFTRGLLDLESAALTPICAALVETDPAMLDDLPQHAEAFLKKAKQELQRRLTGAVEEPASGSSSPQGSASSRLLTPSGSTSWSRGITPLVLRREDMAEKVPVMLDQLQLLQQHLSTVCKELQATDETQIIDGPRADGQGSGARQVICGTVSLVLVRKRWQKLQGDLWDSKQGVWNTAKVPEIYDAVKFDLIHHPQLAAGFGPVYEVAKRINDIMVPNEYGHDERSRIKIGAMVCGQLLRKLLADLRKSAGGAGLGTGEELPERKLVTAAQYLKRIFALPKWLTAQQDTPGDSSSGSLRVAEDDEFREAELAEPDPRHAVGVMNTPNRRVRTRLYFTSESHIQTLMNVLRYCHQSPDKWREQENGSSASDSERLSDRPDDASAASRSGIVCAEAEESLRAQPVFDYLTHVVFRLYEDKLAPLGSPERHRVEVLFSPGAAGHPQQCSSQHMMELKELQPLHLPGQPLTLARLQKLLGPFAREVAAEQPTTSTGGSASIAVG